MLTTLDDKAVLSSRSEDKDALKALITDTLDAILDSIEDDSAFSGIDPYRLRDAVAGLGFLPEEGMEWQDTMESIRKTILPNMLRTWSPSYMPHLHSPALLESIASELIIAVFNNSMDSWDQSPVATEIEESMIHGLCSLFGYGEDADGSFTS